MKYFLVLVASLAMMSCAHEEEYGPGEKDLEDCMHFYFPVNENARHHELELDAPTVLTFKANRVVTDTEAYIPFVVKSEDEDIFDVEEIYFGKYEDETEFEVSFDNAELGKEYTCTIVVEDPEYVSAYGLEATEITFSVMRVKWNYLGEGRWRDDFLSSGFKCAEPYLETKCKVYERDDLKGFYKLEEVYTPEYVAMLMEGNLDYLADWDSMMEDSPIYVNMVNPEKPYLEVSYLGLVMGNYGEAYIASDVPEILGAANSNYQYCILENGVLTAPKGGVLFELSSLGAMLANQSEMFRFVLPGATPYDYTISLSNEETAEGVVPVTFTLGTDVKTVKYAVFDGRVNEVEIVAKVEEIKNGTTAVKTVEESCTLEMEFQKSGFYTLVACSYDASGSYQKSASLHFGYDSADDPREVKLTAGLIVSDKNAPSGMTSENSMEFYVYGEDILDAKVALFKKSQYDNFQEELRKEIDYYIESLNSRQLDSLNKTGYTGVIGGLASGTEYALVVYADNGYHVEYIEASAKTEGNPDVLNEEYIIYDLSLDGQPATQDTYFQEWELWSLDPFEAGAEGRKYRSNVTIYDKEDLYFDEEGKQTDDVENSIESISRVAASGFFPDLASEYTFTDEIDFEFYEGFLYSLTYQDLVTGSYGGKDVYMANAYYYIEDKTLKATVGNFLMVGGFCRDGVVAFVANPTSGINAFAMGLCYFKKSNMSDDGILLQSEVHAYPILVDPDSPYLEASDDASALKAPASCEAVLSEYMSMSRRNYVETDRGYVKSTIDMIKSRPYNYMERAEECAVSAGCDAVDFSAKAAGTETSSRREARSGVWTRDSFLK